jgi:SAM-dependent methyltransferase
MSTSPAIDAVAALKDVHRSTWASGDYPAVAEHIAAGPPAAALAAVAAGPGDHVLDVATGSGNAAVMAARLGLRVTGLDLVPDLLDVARSRAAAEGVEVDLVAGDAEALPFADGAFDRTVSVFGIQFAPRHQQVADELVRVTRPGGSIGLVNWTPDGLIGRVLRTIGKYVPAPPPFASPPPLWGDEGHVRALFARHDVELDFWRETNPWRFASVEEFMTFFEQAYGPMIKVRERLEAEGTWGDAREELIALLHAFNHANDGSFDAKAEYLVVSARRSA